MVKLSAHTNHSDHELNALRAKLGRMQMDKKQLEETIGVVAGVVSRTTPRGPGGPAAFDI